jgi:membrane protein
VAAVGWQGFSKLFSVYVAHFQDYANIYGSVYAMALGMLWLYFCMSILLFGGVLNRVIIRWGQA